MSLNGLGWCIMKWPLRSTPIPQPQEFLAGRLSIIGQRSKDLNGMASTAILKNVNNLAAQSTNYTLLLTSPKLRGPGKCLGATVKGHMPCFRPGTGLADPGQELLVPVSKTHRAKLLLRQAPPLCPPNTADLPYKFA